MNGSRDTSPHIAAAGVIKSDCHMLIAKTD
jgi:hypothetical protein